MTQLNLFSLVMIAGLFHGSLWAEPQESAIERELLTQFAPTKFEKSKVVKAGVVLVVQKEGIGAISPNGGMSMGRLGGSDLTFPNSYKSGTIRHDGKALFLNSAGAIRDLAPNEKVYVLKIEVKDSSVLVAVQSCGTCDPHLPDPEHVPARANVTFQLGKPYLAAATPAQVAEIIGHVFGAASADGPVSNQTAPPAEVPPPTQSQPAAPMAPIPPPPPPPDATPAPPAAPIEVKIGQTTDEVKAALGAPLQIFNLGPKVVYKYKSLKVTFVNGKVSDVE